MEHSWSAYILMIVLLCSAGCLNTQVGEPPAKPTTASPTITVPTTENPQATVPPSDMALQLADLPSDYILRDRSVMASPEISQLSMDLGWRQGYFVSFYRLNSNYNALTRIRQSISIFSLDSMNEVFLIEKEDLKNEQLSPAQRYEIPFPAIGERSVAFRETNPADPERPVTYSVIFTKKNVYEKIIMTGTTTDYELLKQLAMRAEARVR